MFPLNRLWWLPPILLAGAAIAWWLYRGNEEASVPPSSRRLNTATWRTGWPVSGTLKPFRSVEVGAQVSGQLQKLHVREGHKVGKGDLVAEIDATVQRSRVEERRARLRAQEAQLVSYRSKLELAKTNAERQARLLAEDASSQSSFDSARDQLVSWESNLVRLRSEIEQSLASLASEEALLGYSRIYAPIGGTVIDVRMVEGQTLIATQQTPVIMEIADMETMWIEALVPEADISRIAPGMETQVLAVGGGVRQWEAKLGQILPNPKVEDGVVRYMVLFRVDNSDGALLPNMTAHVFIITSSARNVLTVPFRALIFSADDEAAGTGGEAEGEGSRAEVRYVSGDGDFELRGVEVGVTSRVNAEILSGLEEGDRVVAGTL